MLWSSCARVLSVFVQAKRLPNVPVGLRIKENKEVYEGEVTELTPEETENQVNSHNVCSCSHHLCINGLQLAQGIW